MADNAIRRRRVEAGLTQGDVAKLLGLSTSQVSRYEAHPERFRQVHLQKLARAFGCSVDDLVGSIAGGRTMAAAVRVVHVHRIVDGVLTDTGDTAPFAYAASVDALAVEVPDNVMAPLVEVDDLLLVDPAVEPHAGAIVLARAPVTGEHVIRKFAPLHPTDPRAPGFRLMAEAQAVPEILASRAHPDGEVIGTAIARQQRLF